jgi:hypothetical protein
MEKAKSYLPFSPLRVLLIVGCVLLLFFKYNSEHPNPEWNTSPDALIISYELGPTEIPYGYIPSFRIWGDGHIVWAVYQADGTRKVLEGYLQHDQMEKLIKEFINAGYFYWFGGGGNSYDYMSINLVDKEGIKLLDANDEISKLVESIESGAGVEPKEFVPTIGFLHVFPIEETEYAHKNIKPAFSWPEDEFGFNLEDFDRFIPDGKLTGKKLNFVWQVVNRSSFIESNGKVYLIGLEIPKITY